MSDGYGRASRDQRDAEERARAKWGHLSDEQQRVRAAWHRLAADVCEALERFFDSVGDRHRRIYEEINAARWSRRG